MKLRKQKKIAHSIFLRLFGLAKLAEQTELNEWLSGPERNRIFLKRIEDPDFQARQFSVYTQYDPQTGWKKVELQLKRNHRKNLNQWLRYAALVVLCAGITFLLRTTSSPDQPENIWQESKLLTSKARLIVEDGKSYELEVTGQSDSLLKLSGNHLINTGHQLKYQERDISASCQQHLLQVPRGGEFSLILSDGTRVWLNAETELRYPSYFSGSYRKVRLKGEAYFEVAPNTHMPFIVETNELQINVVGTAFNVSAYPGEKQHTTLAEGKIKASYAGQTEILQPGEQLVITPSGMIIREVDVSNYTGWKGKRFAFRNKPIEEVIHDLERWYDIRIIVLPEIRNIRLTANLPKYEKIEKVLDIIKDIARVKCTVNGQTIIIGPES